MVFKVSAVVIKLPLTHILASFLVPKLINFQRKISALTGQEIIHMTAIRKCESKYRTSHPASSMIIVRKYHPVSWLCSCGTRKAARNGKNYYLMLTGKRINEYRDVYLRSNYEV